MFEVWAVRINLAVFHSQYQHTPRSTSRQ